jgi:predicted nucleotidyltransferase/predicted transcriptional regulator
MERKQRYGFGSLGVMEISLLEGTIISSLFPEAKDMTIKEIMNRIDYSYERINSALKSLTKKKIIEEKKVGKTLVYSLDLQNLYARSGFGHYMLEREAEFIRKYPVEFNAINEVIRNNSIWIVILFGSYSKSTENKRSDIDLMCVPFSDKKETEKFILSLKHKYGVNISPVVISPSEFRDIGKDNPELWADLKNFGIVFKGEELLYSLMYQDDKRH